MHHQMLMCIMNRTQQSKKELELLPHVKSGAYAIMIDGQTFHILRDQVRHALFGGPAIEELNDVRMFQNGQRLPFVLKTPQGMLVEELGPHRLQRHSLPELVVGAFRQVYRSHSAEADL